MKLKTITNNQAVITANGQSTFFSYDTPICTRSSAGVVLHPNWDYSRTTSKYRSQFLGETTLATRKKLLEGTYPLEEFND